MHACAPPPPDPRVGTVLDPPPDVVLPLPPLGPASRAPDAPPRTWYAYACRNLRYASDPAAHDRIAFAWDGRLDANDAGSIARFRLHAALERSWGAEHARSRGELVEQAALLCRCSAELVEDYATDPIHGAPVEEPDATTPPDPNAALARAVAELARAVAELARAVEELAAAVHNVRDSLGAELTKAIAAARAELATLGPAAPVAARIEPKPADAPAAQTSAAPGGPLIVIRDAVQVQGALADRPDAARARRGTVFVAEDTGQTFTLTGRGWQSSPAGPVGPPGPPGPPGPAATPPVTTDESRANPLDAPERNEYSQPHMATASPSSSDDHGAPLDPATFALAVAPAFAAYRSTWPPSRERYATMSSSEWSSWAAQADVAVLFEALGLYADSTPGAWREGFACVFLRREPESVPDPRLPAEARGGEPSATDWARWAVGLRARGVTIDGYWPYHHARLNDGGVKDRNSSASWAEWAERHKAHLPPVPITDHDGLPLDDTACAAALRLAYDAYHVPASYRLTASQTRSFDGQAWSAWAQRACTRMLFEALGCTAETPAAQWRKVHADVFLRRLPEAEADPRDREEADGAAWMRWLIATRAASSIGDSSTYELALSARLSAASSRAEWVAWADKHASRLPKRAIAADGAAARVAQLRDGYRAYGLREERIVTADKAASWSGTDWAIWADASSVRRMFEALGCTRGTPAVQWCATHHDAFARRLPEAEPDPRGRAEADGVAWMRWLVGLRSKQKQTGGMLSYERALDHGLSRSSSREAFEAWALRVADNLPDRAAPDERAPIVAAVATEADASKDGRMGWTSTEWAEHAAAKWPHAARLFGLQSGKSEPGSWERVERLMDGRTAPALDPQNSEQRTRMTGRDWAEWLVAKGDRGALVLARSAGLDVSSPGPLWSLWFSDAYAVYAEAFGPGITSREDWSSARWVSWLKDTRPAQHALLASLLNAEMPTVSCKAWEPFLARRRVAGGSLAVALAGGKVPDEASARQWAEWAATYDVSATYSAYNAGLSIASSPEAWRKWYIETYALRSDRAWVLGRAAAVIDVVVGDERGSETMANEKVVGKGESDAAAEAKPTTGERMLAAAKSEGTDVAYRVAARQLARAVSEPLAAALAKGLAPAGDATAAEAIRLRAAAFLATDAGEAVVAALLSLVLIAVPEGMLGMDPAIPARIARELRVGAATEGADMLVDLLIAPLRVVVQNNLLGLGPSVALQPVRVDVATSASPPAHEAVAEPARVTNGAGKHHG